MIFLNPAILFGLLAASIPVLIHLLNLRKLKKIEFSTLAFLKELQKNKIRKIKLKQWLLLALRVLIILFLVAGFARPTLEGIAIGGTTSAAKTSSVFILDDTYSMSVVGTNGSHLNQAKQTLNILLGQLQEGDDAVLLKLSERKNELPELSSNLSLIKDQINQVDISSASGTYHQTIIDAAKILEKSNNFNKEIYLLSDFQKSRLSEDENFSDLGELLNDKIKLYTFNFSQRDVFNLSIDDLQINTQIFEKNKPVIFSGTITNHSNRNVNDAVISLFINGERSGQKSITLAANESQTIELEAAVKFSGHIDVFAELEDDDILNDNRRYTNLFIPERLPVMIFTENPADAQFVETALTASDSERPIEITKRPLSQFNSYNLNDFQTVIIIGSAIPNSERLGNYIQNGGGLFIMPGSQTSLAAFKNLMAQIGIDKVNGEFGEKNSTKNSVTFESTDFQHLIFQNIFAENAKKQIESPEIYHHFKINSGSDGKSIIKLLNGSDFLTEFNLFGGKIFLLSVAPVLSWSNFPLKSIFVPLMNKSIYYLASKDREDKNITAGESIEMRLPGGNIPQIRISAPGGREEIINMEGERNYLSYGNTKNAGNYYIFSGETLLNAVSVNNNPLESSTEYFSSEAFEDYLEKINFKGNYLNIPINENPAEIVLQARFGSELWKYFLFAALLFALIEMMIARNAKKELADIKQN